MCHWVVRCRFLAIVDEMLTSLKRTQESLRLLQQWGKGETASGGVADSDKIHMQLVLGTSAKWVGLSLHRLTTTFVREGTHNSSLLSICPSVCMLALYDRCGGVPEAVGGAGCPRRGYARVHATPRSGVLQSPRHRVIICLVVWLIYSLGRVWVSVSEVVCAVNVRMKDPETGWLSLRIDSFYMNAPHPPRETPTD